MDAVDRCLEKVNEAVRFLESSDALIPVASVEIYNNRDLYADWSRQLHRISHELSDRLANLVLFCPGEPPNHTLTVLRQTLDDLLSGLLPIHLVNSKKRGELLTLLNEGKVEITAMRQRSLSGSAN